MALKYKVGDRVKIKSLDWYNENKDADGFVHCGDRVFDDYMSVFCGSVVTIGGVYKYNGYDIREDMQCRTWTDEMIEGLAEEIKPKFKIGDKITNGKDKLTIIQIVSNKYIVEDNFGECGTVYFNTQDGWKLVEEENNDCKKCGLIRNSTRCLFMDNCPHNKQKNIIEIPKGYIFKDENGNIINATKIVLEKVNTLKTQSNNMETETHRGYYTTEEETTNESKKVAWFTFGDNDFADKVELDLSNRELIQEGGKWFVVKKKNEYPKTYEECAKVLLERASVRNDFGYKADLLVALQKLLVCRDAYWNIYGEEMGLGKPWEPDWKDCTKPKYTIHLHCDGHVFGQDVSHTEYRWLSFPTPEMRDAFYENFKDLIEDCKELL